MSIEKDGLKLLIPCLQKLGHSVSQKNGTFDLSIDDSDAEVKAKGKPFADLDFITYTQNQYDAIRRGHDFDTYIVCGVSKGIPELFRLPSKSLRSVDATPWTLYSYSKRLLSGLLDKGLMERMSL